MRLIVISGLSGAGKSIALNTLEDQGFSCSDNLPVTLLPAFAELMAGPHGELYENVGVGIDARNPADVLEYLPNVFADLRANGIECKLLFLDSDDPILVKRFNETRRKHPLSSDGVSLPEAIKRERAKLEPLAEIADLRIDTSNTNLHQLRDVIRQRIGADSTSRMSILIESFGFKHGAPRDADFMFDVRCLPNPHWAPKLRPLTGLDKEVQEFLESHSHVDRMFLDIRTFLEAWIPRFQEENRSYLTVAIGCTGGQHRSVYITHRLGQHLKNLYGDSVIVRHCELSQEAG